MTTVAPSFPSIDDGSSSDGGEPAWLLYAPCKCVAASMVTRIPGKGPLLDEDSVWEASWLGPVRQRRMRAEGWRWEWVSAAAARYDSDRDCPHTPRYLSSMFTVPEGYTWASLSRTSTVEHLVRDWEEDLFRDDPTGPVSDDVAPLCSTEADGPWWKIAHADPCPDCEREARRIERESALPT